MMRQTISCRCRCRCRCRCQVTLSLLICLLQHVGPAPVRLRLRLCVAVFNDDVALDRWVDGLIALKWRYLQLVLAFFNRHVCHTAKCRTGRRRKMLDEDAGLATSFTEGIYLSNAIISPQGWRKTIGSSNQSGWKGERKGNRLKGQTDRQRDWSGSCQSAVGSRESRHSRLMSAICFCLGY